MQSTQGLEPTIRLPRGLAELTFALVVVLAAVAVAAALAATPAFAAYPGQNGKFVWEKGPCPNCGLVLVDRNGSTRITAAGTFGEPGAQIVRDDQFAVISPDGEWVAFQRWERAPDFRPAGDSGLYVIRADGTGLRMLDAHTQAMSDQTRPTWSSDGTEIAYANPATGEVTIVDASGPPNPRIIPITAGGTDLYMAYVVWSPTNDVLAGFYGRGETKGVGLLPVDADAASDLTPLASTHLNDFAGYSEPSWSPDGQRVAFTHTELDAVRNVGTTRIETIKRDGTDKRALTPFPVGGSGAAAYMEHPLWSPDGEWIVWKLTAGTSAKWEGAHPDGSARSPIAVGGGEASWGPCFTACASLLPAGPDQDDDGVPDATDSCPAEAGPASNQGCPLVIADEDGDGVPDAVDSCPTQPGPVSNEGCPVAVPPLDSDGDGVPNASDSCPTQAGPASNAGCPVTVPPLDSDGDGVPNASDSCPTQAGPASNAGCPVTVPPLDSDGDGVPNASDSCPTQAGPASNAGCPVTVPPLDSDGDGVPTASDSCPTQPGPVSNEGCPVAVPPLDSDGDGVPNASDSCPTQAGPASNAGCPLTVPPLDSDGDGVPNASDSCPTQAGPASNAGCPLVAGDSAGPVVVIPSSNRRILVTPRARLRFKIGPTNENTTGILTLRTANKFKLGRPTARIVKLGSKPFRAANGHRVGVTIKLSKRVMALLRRSESLRVRATVTLQDEAHNVSKKDYRFTIRPSRQH